LNPSYLVRTTTAGQSEQRPFRIRYRDRDLQVGLFSGILTATVVP
jgi:hypothetical protein